MFSRRALLVSAAAAAPTFGSLSALMSGCGNASRAPRPGAALDKVIYLTGFGTTLRECYPWAGLSKGFFTDAGIELIIKPGQPADANLKTLAAGQAQFAAIDYVSAVRGTAVFPRYRAVAAVQQTTLLSLISLSGRGIAGPRDLAGRTVGTASKTAATQTMFPAYAKLASLDPRTVTFVNSPSDQLPGLLAAGKIDAMGTYAVDTPGIKAAAHGAEPVVLTYSQYLTDLYGTVLITSTDTLTNQRDLVERFTGAMIKTVRWAVTNPTDAGALVHSRLRVIDADLFAQTMELMKPYITGADLEATRVAQGIALLQQAGLVTSGLQPEQVVDFDMAAAVNK